MADTNKDWELSKENIQPIQQGRKHKVLKVALATHPEDVISQQRQDFENELRTYSGDDPLSVWCKYIKWVEQNFPKGGKEGHIKLLLENCLSVLKDEEKYYNDIRFVDIWIKFACSNIKPLEIYNHMYSHNIGCKVAQFFIVWSWELEQLGNFKKADEVLREGIQRKAEPLDKLQSHYNEFEMRLIQKVKETENDIDVDSGRSAFSVLKPQTKNKAPISRIGESVIESNKPLLLGRQQPQTKYNTMLGKVPFKIYNSENIAPSLPVQTQSVTPHLLNNENLKENELKPSKWNKVKVKSNPQVERIYNESNPGFNFHSDDEIQPPTSSKAKASNVLRIHCGNDTPPIALFEAPDPTKKPMYDKIKVYGGAEEYSFEEIRAAAWFENKKKIEQEQAIAVMKRKMEEQEMKNKKLEMQIEQLQKTVEILQSNISCNNKSASRIHENVSQDGNLNKSAFRIHENIYQDSNVKNVHVTSASKNMIEKPQQFNTFENKFGNANSSYKIVQELYNDTFTHPKNEDKEHLDPYDTSNCKEILSDSHKNIFNNRGNLQFDFFHDPTEVISQLKANEFSESINNFVENVAYPNSNVSKEECFKENIENVPPKEYIQECHKRELAGVLEPSKNILYIPLEEQYEMQDDSDTEDGQDCIQANETLVPPSNTEQFTTAKFLASTPCPKRNETVDKVTVTKICSNVFDNENPNVTTGMLNSVKNKVLLPLVLKPEMKDFHGNLSVIIETSENCSKSSSSSSTASLTKFINSDLHSSHGSFRRHNLKSETVHEPLALSTVSEVPCTSELSPKEVIHTSSRSEKNINFELFSVDFDPFDIKLTNTFLNSRSFYYNNVCCTNKSIKCIKVGETITVQKTAFLVENLIAEGAYAKVYEAKKQLSVYDNYTNPSKNALKVCKNANEWELYICTELHKRLEQTNLLPSIKTSVMKIDYAVKYTDGIVLFNEYCDSGTLLHLVNFYKKQNSTIPEFVALYLTWEILHIVSKIHECNIIHADIKPDNFLILPNAFDCSVLDNFSTLSCLRLIDFGRAIDLNMFEKGVCFTSTMSKQFRCVEMNENKPWVFQLDWYGVLNCVHAILFCDYMSVQKVGDRWQIKKKIKRYWYTPFWNLLFKELLNIPACYKEPDLKQLMTMIENKLRENRKNLECQLFNLSTSYYRKK